MDFLAPEDDHYRAYRLETAWISDLLLDVGALTSGFSVIALLLVPIARTFRPKAKIINV